MNNSLLLRQGQSWLIMKMWELNYRSDAAGICFGIANMAMQAILANDIDTFVQRLEIIQDTTDLAKAIKTAEKKRLSGAILTTTDLRILEVLPFFDGIELYLQAFEYPHLFETNACPKMQDTLKTAALTTSASVEQAGGIVHSGSFSSIYTTNELKVLLKTLRETITHDKLTSPMAIVLSSSEHTITVNYHPVKKTWQLFDANHLAVTEIEQDDAMAHFISSAFCKTRSPKLALLGEVYTTRQQAASVHSSLMNWFRHPSLIEMHAITKHKASQLDNVSNSNWLFLSVLGAQLDTVKNLLLNKADPNIAIQPTGATPLLVSVKAGQTDIATALLRHGANPNQAMANSGLTPLFIAAQDNHIELATILLANGANIHAPLTTNAEALHFFAQGHQINDKMKKFIRAKIGTGAVPARIAITPYELATMMERKELLRLFDSTLPAMAPAKQGFNIFSRSFFMRKKAVNDERFGGVKKNFS